MKQVAGLKAAVSFPISMRFLTWQNCAASRNSRSVCSLVVAETAGPKPDLGARAPKKKQNKVLF